MTTCECTEAAVATGCADHDRPVYTGSPGADPDTVQLAALITQVLSGGAVTDPPAEVIHAAALVKANGWTRGCCGGACA